MQAGQFISSTPALEGTVFENTVIFIAEYNDKGALGFVTNQPFSRGLNELEEFRHGKAFPLYLGGPVDREHLYFVHRRPDLIAGGAEVDGEIFFGGDFNTTVELINQNLLTERDVRIFIGYCGWEKGELDAEIAEGSWDLLEAATLF
ncbi:YqgE/AlgH family protein [Chitinophaga rhizosphaerae]|uniref:YqgE/AlgH family protein n=1 Tax=Chitinophaga rhizosphaerae TaxID=1864947 RepID=UPI000F80A0BC|nr:YqgE/AlgH family protein [Chitinophaga rhizosphaerae]